MSPAVKHVRASLIALHLFAITAMALPSASGGMNRKAWQDPTVQEEFAAWTVRLNAWGISGTFQEFQDQAWDLVSAYESGRGHMLAPFRPYFKYCGTWQSWRMFVAPHRYPAKLHIDIQENGVWRPVYVARSPDHAWLGTELNHDRFRSAIFRYAWPHYASAYRGFSGWVRDRARLDFPGASKVRLRFWKVRTPSPEEVLEGREPNGRWVRARVMGL